MTPRYKLQLFTGMFSEGVTAYQVKLIDQHDGDRVVFDTTIAHAGDRPLCFNEVLVMEQSEATFKTEQSDEK